MTDNTTTPGDAESRVTSALSQLRRLLRRFDPTLLGLLGFLSLPAYVFDSLAFLELFSAFYIFFLWILVGPILDMVLARGTGTETEPTDWIQAGGTRDLVVAYLMLPLTFLNPLTVTQDLLQLAGGAVAFVRNRGSLPDAGSTDQQVSYRLPFEGTWTVVNGSPEREHSHSWIYPNQRYAYDFLITDETGASRPEGSGTALERYYCYDEPVVAPADGVVVDTYDTALETSRGGGFSHPLKRDIRGSYVTIKHAESEYSTLAHLVPGSVAVEPGEQVRRGQQIGRCGHSGNSSEPHLHFQVQDHPEFAAAASLPVQFDDVEIEYPGVTHEDDLVPGYDTWYADETDPATDARVGNEEPTGAPEGRHERTFIIAGQRVTHADDGDPTEQHRTPAQAVADTQPAPAPVVSTGRAITNTLKRAAFGIAVGGIVTFIAGLFTSGLTIAALLGGAGTVGVAFHYGFLLRSGDGFQFRPGWPGASLGLALAAAAVGAAVVTGAVGTGTLTGLLLFAGVVGYAALATYDGRRLRSAVGRGAVAS